MKKFNDSKIYFYMSIITTSMTIILAVIAAYSMLKIEPEIEKFLSEKKDISENYKAAYIMLRKPQVFARYENFDTHSQSIKTIINNFDRRIFEKDEFIEDDEIYLRVLLERRMLGSRLSRNSSVFFLILSFLGWGAFFYEKASVKKT